jgi:hypothetical protein
LANKLLALISNKIKQSNDENAKALIEEASKDFQIVKKISREYESYTRHLPRHMPALPPDQITNIEEELKLVNNWKRYINWEKKNPLKLKSDDLVKKRVMFAYEQSFSCLGYHCDIWHEAACFLYNFYRNKPNAEQLQKEAEHEASYLYERAINTYMRNNLLIHLVYSDFEEIRGCYQKCYEIYEKCLQNVNIDATLTWIHYIRLVYKRIFI